MRNPLDVPPPLDILNGYWTEQVSFGLLYVMFTFPTRIFYRGVPGFATGCPCGVWYCGLTTCLLYVGPLFRNLVSQNLKLNNHDHKSTRILSHHLSSRETHRAYKDTARWQTDNFFSNCLQPCNKIFQLYLKTQSVPRYQESSSEIWNELRFILVT